MQVLTMLCSGLVAGRRRAAAPTGISNVFRGSCLINSELSRAEH